MENTFSNFNENSNLHHIEEQIKYLEELRAKKKRPASTGITQEFIKKFKMEDQYAELSEIPDINGYLLASLSESQKDVEELKVDNTQIVKTQENDFSQRLSINRREILVSEQSIEETKSPNSQLLVKRKSLRMSWKENLIDEVLKELDNSSVNKVYNIYGQRIPLRTLRYWAIHRKSKKMHHKKGKRTKLGYLELLLFEWFLFQRGLGNVMN